MVKLLASFLESDFVFLQLMGVMIKDHIRIVMNTSHAYLKMKVLGGSTSSTSCKGYLLSAFHVVANLYEVLGIVAVKGFETIGVTKDDAVAIAAIDLRHRHHTVESGIDGVVGLGLQVYTRVRTSSACAIRTDDLGSRQGIAPFFIRDAGEVEREL